MVETPRSRLPRRITDPILVAEATVLMASEEATCPACQKNARLPQEKRSGPAHFGAYLRDGYLVQTPCDSYNRVFDPAIHAFVGRAECTCDSCW